MQDSENEIKSGLYRLYESGFDRRLSPTKDVQIQDLARISDGWETEVYAFAVEHGRANDRAREDLILRIYPGDDASQKSAHEFNVMKQLHTVGYPVPQVLLLETDDAYFGKPFVIMERIIGRSMGAIAEGAPAEAGHELLARFCQMYVDLHDLDWRPFVPDSALHEFQDPSGLFARQLSEWQAFVHTRQMGCFEPVFDWLRSRLPGVGFRPPSLLHWDYHPYNVLVREDGAAFAIDWGGAIIADYRLDLAWTLLLMSAYGRPDLWALVLDGYERAAGHRVDRIEYFAVFACLRRLFDISSTLLVGAAKAGLRPGAEAMIKNAAHIDYVYALLQERTGMTIPEVERLLATLR